MLRFNPLRRIAFQLFYPTRLFAKPMIRNQMFKRLQSLKANPAPKKPTGVKALVKEYGYSALGVYLAISAIDLPLCYILVHSMGEEEISYYENKVKQAFGYGMSDDELQKKLEINKIQKQVDNEGADEKATGKDVLSRILAQFSWTEFAIAYGIHKSLIFIRVPLVAAITPSIVKVLRRWGFKIGTDNLSTTANIVSGAIKDITATNPKFGTKPTKKNKWFSWFF